MGKYYKDNDIRIIFMEDDPTKIDLEALDGFLEGAEKRELTNCIESIVITHGALSVNFLNRIYVEFTFDTDSGRIEGISSFEGIKR